MPVVTTIYPTSDTLPENLLRFYVQFSKPMKTINNLENIELVDEDGNVVKGAIFNNVYELWDKEQQQLTLILDPARVKTGLVAHKERGRALQAGKSFQLVIRQAEDIYGNQLKVPFIKPIYVIATDTVSPDISHWNIFALCQAQALTLRPAQHVCWCRPHPRPANKRCLDVFPSALPCVFVYWITYHMQ